MIGSVSSRIQEDIKAIDINFADITNKKKVTFLDNYSFSLAALNNCGLILASKTIEDNYDEYEKEDKRKCAIIQFKSVHSFSRIKDWLIELPSGEVKLF